MNGLYPDHHPDTPRAASRSGDEYNHRSPSHGAARGEARSWSLPEYLEGRALISAPGNEPRTTYDVVTSGGRRFTVSLTAEPLVDLQRSLPVAAYLRTRMRPAASAPGDPAVERGFSDPRDLERIEGMEFRRGMALLLDTNAERAVIPLSWRLASSEGAFAALNSGLQPPLDPKTHVIAELRDVPAGVSGEALGAVVRSVAARRRAVCVHLPLDVNAIEAVAGCGFNGIVLTVDPETMASGSGRGRLTRVIRAAQAAAPTVLVDGAPLEQRDMLRDAGATHAVFAKLASRLI